MARSRTSPLRRMSARTEQVPYAVSKLAAEYYIFALGELNRHRDGGSAHLQRVRARNRRVPPARSSVIPLYVKNILTAHRS